VQVGATTDPRSDIYSLGAVGYFMLTRSYIFDAESVDDIQQKQLDDAPIPPTRRTANPISSEMEQLLLQCLEKDRDRRPQSANELRAALLALEAAAEWTTEASTAWWKDFESKPTSTATGAEAEIPSAMPTLSVDLAGR
jgi:serine/threonine protein kinase